jgi:copper chaperone CopZ
MSQSISLAVSGMKCGGCESNVFSKLSQLSGVISVKASHQDKQVDVEYDPELIAIEEIEDAIIDAGFTIE